MKVSKLLNTASMFGPIGQRSHAAYVATRGAMIWLTKAMAADYSWYRMFLSGCSSFACLVWLRLLHILDVSEQCSPMIKPVAVGHIIARTSHGIVVFMNMSLFRPLF